MSLYSIRHVNRFSRAFVKKKMASPPKKTKLSASNVKTDDQINEIASQAADIQFPWDSVSPIYFTDWIDMFSKAHGTSKELMFKAILPTVSSLLGLSKLKATTTYQENLTLFSLCISPPPGGKTSASHLDVKSPLQKWKSFSTKVCSAG